MKNFNLKQFTQLKFTTFAFVPFSLLNSNYKEYFFHSLGQTQRVP